MDLYRAEEMDVPVSEWDEISVAPYKKIDADNPLTQLQAKEFAGLGERAVCISKHLLDGQFLEQ